MRLVIFFGPDGAGKSTQANLLSSYLRSRGLKVRTVWIRAHHSIAYLLLSVMMGADLDYDPFLKDTRVGQILRRLKIWSFVEFISVLPWILLRVYLPLLLGYVVVCERYVVDTIVSIMYTLEKPKFYNNIIAKTLLCFIPSNAVMFHLTGEVSSLAERCREGEAVRNSIRFQKSTYQAFAEVLGATIIDTSRLGIKETFEEICRFLKLTETI